MGIYIKNMKIPAAEELLKNLKYCSCDPYYMEWWEETCKEIADRLFVNWEKI